jgi:CelD/BcsL family acetyltransferase involved in cellulose biosynthesis
VPGILQQLQNKFKGAWRQFFGNGFDHCAEPIASGTLRARCQEDWPTDTGFVAAWNRLHAAVPTATTFHTYPWQCAVFETLCKPGRLRLITVWSNTNDLVAVFPMSMRDDGLLETLGPAVSDYLEPLIDPAHETQVWPLLLKLFSKLRSERRRNVTLHNIRDDAACRKVLAGLAPAEGFAFEEKRVEQTPVLSLPPSWDDFLAALDPHERKETRRKINKAQTKGNARLVRCSADPAQINAALAHTFALMEQSPGDKGDAVRKTIRPLLEKAAPALIQSGHLLLTTLYVNDEPAAVTLECPYPSGPQLYNCGFEAAKKEWSPGVVLTSLIIKEAIENGAKEFDLLRGQEAYKYRIGAKDRPLWMITLRKL